MSSSSLVRCVVVLLLAQGLSGASCGGGGPSTDETDAGDLFECSHTRGSDYRKASGSLAVTVEGQAVGPWRLGISPVARADGEYVVMFSGCVLAGGVETWRFASSASLQGPVPKGSPVKLPVPRSSAPGYTGGLLEVGANQEHHFLLKGAGELEVLEFDPSARRFVARGEMYPEQGGTVTLSWELTW
jgi:hypothetical protein